MITVLGSSTQTGQSLMNNNLTKTYKMVIILSYTPKVPKQLVGPEILF